MWKNLRSGILVLALIASATALWAAAGAYNPPPEVGMIWTVINFQFENGRNQPATVNVIWDRPRRQVVVPAPSYGNSCSTSTPAGFVFRLQHNDSNSVPLSIKTTGRIIRGPYQGEAPPETLHACYKLVKG